MTTTTTTVIITIKTSNILNTFPKHNKKYKKKPRKLNILNASLKQKPKTKQATTNAATIIFNSQAKNEINIETKK